MKNNFFFFLSLFSICWLALSCHHKLSTINADKRTPLYIVDAKATTETKALFQNMYHLSRQGKTMFGHQDATWYGIGWKGDVNRSDVKSVTGEHPAVYGWDLQNIVREMLKSPDGQSTEATTIRKLVVEAYKRGGVNTFSWHMHHPVSQKNMYDTLTSGGVSSILPGGAKHPYYQECLDKVSEFFASLKGEDGELIPVIFRPFHEHNGNWFWWCKPFCTPNEYKKLIQFTVEYLRDKKQIHNLLYAYATDRIDNWEDYIERYPGDAYIDIVGMDNYWDFKDVQSSVKAVHSLQLVAQYALDKNKVAALTETGLEKIPDSAWFTNVLWRPIQKDSIAKKIAYLLVWRNAHEGHFYAPYPNHSSAMDFLRFYKDSNTLFEKDIPNIYTHKRKL